MTKKLSPARQAVVDKLRAGSTLYFHPEKRGRDYMYGYWLRSPEGTGENVATSVGHWLVDNGVVAKDEVQARRFGPWTYHLAQPGQEAAS